MMHAVAKPRAKVEICTDPLLGGVDQALDWQRLQEIIDMYPMVDLFLLCVDRDGNEGRRAALDDIEKKALAALPANRGFLAANAWQELEVWALAGHNLPRDWAWKEIRQEVHPKETYFLPYAEQRGLLEEPGEGRKSLALEAVKRYGERPEIS